MQEDRESDVENDTPFIINSGDERTDHPRVVELLRKPYDSVEMNLIEASKLDKLRKIQHRLNLQREDRIPAPDSRTKIYTRRRRANNERHRQQHKRLATECCNSLTPTARPRSQRAAADTLSRSLGIKASIKIRLAATASAGGASS
ncbi:unnamed protein product [Danaus chrysippus]|uniref:(African queen) hypothetical protein n=1 Tax=Danaus chrysippus TaxID=151541 RepID=A0A8J2QMB9_9NEOP|nr:unnamed protein product [Danaus chrysippus]